MEKQNFKIKMYLTQLVLTYDSISGHPYLGGIHILF